MGNVVLAIKRSRITINDMRQFFNGIFKTLILAFVAVVIIHQFIFEPYVVSDSFMAPAYQQGDVILVLRYPYFGGDIRRKETVLFRVSSDIQKRALRTILGLPQEYITVNEGIATVRDSNKQVLAIKELPNFSNLLDTIPPAGYLDDHEYFVISSASVAPYSGIIDKRFIVGRPFLRIFPLHRFSVIK